MSVSLQKGGNVSLTKSAPGLTAVKVGLGWDARTTDGTGFDLDSSVFLLTDAGTIRNDQDFIFYNNLTSPDGSVKHLGDNPTGGGQGDDEVVEVDLTKVAADVGKLRFCVTIHDADTRKQNFGMVNNAFIRVVNKTDGQEITRYDLTEDFSTETALIFGELYRHNNEWKFKAVGQGYAGGLAALARDCGVNLAAS